MSIDLPREQRLVDLAIKLHHGKITPEEQRDAANELSFTAGERLGLEVKAQNLEKRLDFITRVLRIFWVEDYEEMLFWRVDKGQPKFFVNCNDTFSWATADVEEITPANVHLLEQSVEDVKVLEDLLERGSWGFTLFCARVRGIRVMPMMKVPAPLQAMFDACGPSRTSNDFLQ